MKIETTAPSAERVADGVETRSARNAAVVFHVKLLALPFTRKRRRFADIYPGSASVKTGGRQRARKPDDDARCASPGSAVNGVISTCSNELLGLHGTPSGMRCRDVSRETSLAPLPEGDRRRLVLFWCPSVLVLRRIAEATQPRDAATRRSQDADAEGPSDLRPAHASAGAEWVDDAVKA